MAEEEKAKLAAAEKEISVAESSKRRPPFAEEENEAIISKKARQVGA